MANEPNVYQIMQQLSNALKEVPEKTKLVKSGWYYKLRTFYPKKNTHMGLCLIEPKAKLTSCPLNKSSHNQ